MCLVLFMLWGGFVAERFGRQLWLFPHDWEHTGAKETQNEAMRGYWAPGWFSPQASSLLHRHLHQAAPWSTSTQQPVSQVPLIVLKWLHFFLPLPLPLPLHWCQGSPFSYHHPSWKSLTLYYLPEAWGCFMLPLPWRLLTSGSLSAESSVPGAVRYR